MSTPTEDHSLNHVLALLERRTGLRLAAQREALLAACVELCLELGAALPLSLPELVLRLEADEALLYGLAARFTVPETHFFRVWPQIEALRDTVLPALLATERHTRRLRLWSAGCSTGEEAYTLAMLVGETLPGGWGPSDGRGSGAEARGWEVTVLGTDLNPGSLEVARAARYSAWSFRGTDPELRERHFEDHGAYWTPRASLRRMTEFHELNLLAPEWPRWGRFHLILCRNVTIYFSPSVARGVYTRLSELLEPGGWLLLGPSDPPPLPETLKAMGLEAQFIGGAILYRKTGTAPRVRLELATAPRALGPSSGPSRASRLRDAALTPGVVAPAVVQDRKRPGTDEAVSAETDPGATSGDAPWLDWGLQHLEAGELTDALNALRRAAYLNPQSALAQFALARALYSSGQRQRARAALRAAERLLERTTEPEAGLTVQDLQRAVQALSVMLEP